MISRYAYKGLTWVDIESPSRDEITHIMEEFSLPQLVAEEMVNSTLRSKVDLYDNFLYVILHFPVIDPKTGTPSEQEVDFVIGKQFIITIRYEAVEPLHQFAKIFEVNSMLDRNAMVSHAGFIFMQMMKELYIRSLHELDVTMHEIKKIENMIFKQQETSMVKKILMVSRKLLDFKQALRFHRDILHSYESASKKFFGEDYGYYADVITAEFNKVNSLLEGLRETLDELQRTNASLLTTRTNDIVKTLTILTFIMMPLSIISGIFMMNTSENLVFIRSLQDFYFVLGAMFLTSLVIFLYFRHRKWL